MWTDVGPSWSSVAHATTACGGRGGAHVVARAAVGRTRVQIRLATVGGDPVAISEAGVAGDKASPPRAAGGSVRIGARVAARAAAGDVRVQIRLAAVGGV